MPEMLLHATLDGCELVVRELVIGEQHDGGARTRLELPAAGRARAAARVVELTRTHTAPRALGGIFSPHRGQNLHVIMLHGALPAGHQIETVTHALREIATAEPVLPGGVLLLNVAHGLDGATASELHQLTHLLAQALLRSDFASPADRAFYLTYPLER